LLEDYHDAEVMNVGRISSTTTTSSPSKSIDNEGLSQKTVADSRPLARRKPLRQLIQEAHEAVEEKSIAQVVVNQSVKLQKNAPKEWVPLDENLGLQGRYATLEVADLLLEACSELTPGKVVRFWGERGPMRFGRTFVQGLLNTDGINLAQMFNHEGDMILDQVALPEATTALVVQLDGANVPIREPENPRRGPKQHCPELNAGSETSPTAWKNSMVGSVSFYGTSATQTSKPNRQRKPLLEKVESSVKLVPIARLRSLYWAQMPQSEFIQFKQTTASVIESLENKLPENRSVAKILLMDGARHLWNDAETSGLYDDYEWGIDFYHATEHLATVAETLHGSEAKTWFGKWVKKLKYENGAVLRLVEEIELEIGKNITKLKSEILERERNFFWKNHALMEYQKFIDKGWPIGTGVIEAGCKVLVKSRLCRSGMRWSCEKGQATLTIRALDKSGLWDEGWNAYRNKVLGKATLQAA
jgi:hypothetical protein